MHVKFDEECDKFGGCYTRSRRGHKIFYGFSAHKNAVKRLISMLLRRVLSAFLIREPSSIRSFALNNHQNFICFQLPECDESIRAVSNREHFSSALLLKQVSASLRLALHVISSHCAERADCYISRQKWYHRTNKRRLDFLAGNIAIIAFAIAETSNKFNKHCHKEHHKKYMQAAKSQDEYWFEHNADQILWLAQSARVVFLQNIELLWLDS